MIKVNRSPAPPALDLTIVTSPAYKERQVIIDYLDEHKVLPAEKEFNVYNSEAVKSALRAMFHGKCAYCEINVAGGFDGDVEHYRPKGGVTEADQAGVVHPGYWWLAMAWDNLVLSCQHCNQSRRQLIHEAGQDEATIERELREGRRETAGKKNRFPVADNKWVVDYCADVAGEPALLIDPTRVDPKDLFEWEFERSISTVKARDGNAKAAATIDILGLNRRHLTEGRVAVLNTFRKKRQKILKKVAKIASKRTSSEVAAALSETLVDDLEELDASCGQQNQFAGMARAFYAKVEAEIEKRL